VSPWWYGQELREPDSGVDRTSETQLDSTVWLSGARLPLESNPKRSTCPTLKGHGSLNERRAKETGWNSTITSVAVSSSKWPNAKRGRHHEEVNGQNRRPRACRGMEKTSERRQTRPVPARHGTVRYEHVKYITRKPQPYDQGVVRRHQGGKAMAIRTWCVRRKVTPNHTPCPQFHAVRQFYCRGVISADGHPGSTRLRQRITSKTLLGGFTPQLSGRGARSDRRRSDGFCGTTALLRKKTFRNYGEHCNTTESPGPRRTWSEVYADLQERHQQGQVPASSPTGPA